MEDFSSRLFSKTKELEDNVDKLMYESKSLGVKVETTFSDFLMLSNSQFIENVGKLSP
jgi:WASH complex subunit FAM21